MTAAWLRLSLAKDCFLECAPAGRTALVCVLEADDVVYVYIVAGFASVKAYGGVGLITAVLEVFAIVPFCK